MNQSILAAGISFSVHIGQAIAIAERLYEDGEFERGYIGITARHSPTQNGIYVKKVIKGSPADKAGLQQGQRIIEVDGVPIGTEHDLKWSIAQAEPGENLVIEIMANKKTQKINVLVASAKRLQ